MTQVFSAARGEEGMRMQDCMVCLDIGYGQTKLLYDGPQGEQRRVFPSQVELAPETDLGGGLLGARNNFRVRVGDLSYDVGEDVAQSGNAVGNLNDAYLETPEYQALFHAALLATGLTRVDLLVTGLPVSHFARRKAELARLMTGFQRVTAHHTVSVRRVLVVPQPMGGLMAHVTQKNLVREASQSTVLVVDPGQHTVDWLVVHDMKLNPLRSGSHAGGVAQVLTALQKLLKAQYGGAPSLAVLSLRLARQAHTLHIRGQEVVLAPLLARAALDVVAAGVKALRNQLQEQSDIDRIIVVGGGAPLFLPALRQAFPGVPTELADDPVFANVMGYRLLGLSASLRQEAPHQAHTGRPS